MTLEEKALEYSLKINGFTKEDCYDEKGELRQFIKSDMDIYLAGARELEKENAELKEKLKEKLKTIADKDLSFVAKFDALEKENAKLQEISKRFEPQAFTDVMNEVEENYKNKEQLKQAKEIIKKCVHILKHSGTALEWNDAIGQAEQFLKEIEK